MRLGFVNYVRDSTRETPINTAAARVVLGGYLIWKTMWYDWHEVSEAPFPLIEKWALLIPDSATILVVEKYLLLLVLLAFVLGYRLRLSTFVSALLVGHLGVVRFAYNTSGGVTALFIAMYFLIFFGLYRHTDELSLDAVRRKRDEPLADLVSRLKSSTRATYRTDALRWNLLVFAVIYFGAGFDKLFHSGLAWLDPVNLNRTFLIRYTLYKPEIPLGATDLVTPLGLWMMEFPVLIRASAAGTLVLELGLLPAALLGVGITPFVLGVYGMTTVIWLTLGILFGDVYFFLAMFFTWDGLHERLARDRDLDLVFDERCSFCARSLYPFKLLDVDDTVTFYSQSDAPERYRNRETVEFEDAMYVFDDDRGYEGYYAFRELLDQFGIFRPLVLLMQFTPVERLGTRIYRYVADNRSRHFACSVDIEK